MSIKKFNIILYQYFFVRFYFIIFYFFLAEDATGKMEFGTFQLLALIAVPVVFVSIIFISVFLLYNRRMKRKMGYALREEHGSCESMPFVQGGQSSTTLKEMLYEYSGSGSGGSLCNIHDINQ